MEKAKAEIEKKKRVDFQSFLIVSGMVYVLVPSKWVCSKYIFQSFLIVSKAVPVYLEPEDAKALLDVFQSFLIVSRT